jgi:hypothetical protein
MTDYERLIKDFCALAGLQDDKSIATGSPIEVGGIVCSITSCRKNDATELVLYVAFGAVPSGREAGIYEELLVQNYVGAPDAGVTFGYSPLAKHVICMQHLRATDVTPQRLVDILHHIAKKAVEWRRTYFLKSIETGAPRESLSTSASRALLGGARALNATKTTG